MNINQKLPNSLILTRRAMESVIIGDPKSPIGRVTVVKISGGKVKISFNFPRAMPVNREEVARQISENIQYNF